MKFLQPFPHELTIFPKEETTEQSTHFQKPGVFHLMQEQPNHDFGYVFTSVTKFTQVTDLKTLGQRGTEKIKQHLFWPQNLRP